MTLLRRFLFVQALLLWQGGFLFYASFVVPIGTEVLGGGFEQGRITRHVTDALNAVGLGALSIFAWELSASAKPFPKARWACWVIMAIGLAALLMLHPRLEELTDFEDREFTDYRQFRYLHRWYLWITTFQWLAGLVFAALTLSAWRSADRGTAVPAAPAAR